MGSTNTLPSSSSLATIVSPENSPSSPLRRTLAPVSSAAGANLAKAQSDHSAQSAVQADVIAKLNAELREARDKVLIPYDTCHLMHGAGCSVLFLCVTLYVKDRAFLYDKSMRSLRSTFQRLLILSLPLSFSSHLILCPHRLSRRCMNMLGYH